MSFGAVQHAISSMKNNRSLLSKRDRLKNTLSNSEGKKVEFKSPEASQSKLLEIRRKMQEENRRRNLKIILVLGFLFSIVLSVFFFYL